MRTHVRTKDKRALGGGTIHTRSHGVFFLYSSRCVTGGKQRETSQRKREANIGRGGQESNEKMKKEKEKNLVDGVAGTLGTMRVFV